MMAFGGLPMMQKDGGAPTQLIAGSARGESGVAVQRLRFQDGLHFNATPQSHLIWFHLSPLVLFDCRFASRAHRHLVPAGTLAICPAGINVGADAHDSVDALIVAVRPNQFALAASKATHEALLLERFLGRDRTLLELARILMMESADNYPNGPLFWNSVASTFIDNLVSRHTSELDGRARGTLGRDMLKRLRDYVMAHLDEPIEVAALADLAGRSPFHFSRVFTRSVGLTPHRYVVHLRMQRAIELIRDGRSGLADIAAQTGFADQSHLSRWVRRVHGVSLTKLMTPTADTSR